MKRHDQLYTVLLIALAFFLGVGIVSTLFMSRLPQFPPEARLAMDVGAAVYGMFLAAIIATLILRAAAPRAGRIATMALNIVLLVLVPVGTALGIYGLLKVDKDRPAPAA